MPEELLREELKTLCNGSGFVRRGQAFFRLRGDGVLQVIKCRYERHLRGSVIAVGLFSMYGPLEPQWFTSSGCIPRYSVTNCAQLNNRPLVCAAPLGEQLELLRSRVLPWLDSIATQKDLLRAILKLDPRWNDGQKLGPYLACGQYNHGKKVLREILFQHDFAGIHRSGFPESANAPTSRDEDLRMLSEQLDREDPGQITAYLQRNLARNMEYAKFCMK